MEADVRRLPPGNPQLVDAIVNLMKCEGIFDELRRESLADVDTKPAYQNLRHRVEGFVDEYLKGTQWRSDLNKNQLRDSVRKRVNNSEMLTTGVDRIVDQAVASKIHQVFLPKVTEIVHKFLGIEVKPAVVPSVSPKHNRLIDSGSSIDEPIAGPSGYKPGVFIDRGVSSPSTTVDGGKLSTSKSISIPAMVVDNMAVQSIRGERTFVNCSSSKTPTEKKVKDAKVAVSDCSKTASTKTDNEPAVDISPRKPDTKTATDDAVKVIKKTSSKTTNSKHDLKNSVKSSIKSKGESTANKKEVSSTTNKMPKNNENKKTSALDKTAEKVHCALKLETRPSKDNPTKSSSDSKDSRSQKPISSAKTTEGKLTKASEKTCSKSRKETDRPKCATSSEKKVPTKSDGKTKFSGGSRFRSLGSSKNVKSSSQSSEKSKVKNPPTDASVRLKSTESSSSSKEKGTGKAPIKVIDKTNVVKVTTLCKRSLEPKASAAVVPSEVVKPSRTQPQLTTGKEGDTLKMDIGCNVPQSSLEILLSGQCSKIIVPVDVAKVLEVEEAADSKLGLTTDIKRALVVDSNPGLPAVSKLGLTVDGRLGLFEDSKLGLAVDGKRGLPVDHKPDVGIDSKLGIPAVGRQDLHSKLGLPVESKLCLTADSKLDRTAISKLGPSVKHSSRTPTPEGIKRDVDDFSDGGHEKITPSPKRANDVRDHAVSSVVDEGTTTIEVPSETKLSTVVTRQTFAEIPAKVNDVDGKRPTMEVSDEYLTDVSVSSVHTSDLSDYDDYISMSSGSDVDDVTSKRTEESTIVDVRDLNAVVEYLLKTVEEILIAEKKAVFVVKTLDASKMKTTVAVEQENFKNVVPNLPPQMLGESESKPKKAVVDDESERTANVTETGPSKGSAESSVTESKTSRKSKRHYPLSNESTPEPKKSEVDSVVITKDKEEVEERTKKPRQSPDLSSKRKSSESTKRERRRVTDVADAKKTAPLDVKKSLSPPIVKRETDDSVYKSGRESEIESLDHEPGGRRGSTRQRRLNPRYASDDFSSIFNQGKDRYSSDMFYEVPHCVRPVVADLTVGTVRGRGRRSTGHSNTTDETDPRGLSPISDVSDIGDVTKTGKATSAGRKLTGKLSSQSEASDGEHNADGRNASRRKPVEPQQCKAKSVSAGSSYTSKQSSTEIKTKSGRVCLEATSKSRPDESMTRRRRGSVVNSMPKVELKLKLERSAEASSRTSKDNKPVESLGRGRREAVVGSSTTSKQLTVDVNTDVQVNKPSDSVARGRRGSAASLDSPPSTRQRALRLESQRYDSTDLYKPRMAFAGSRRSQRGRSPPPPPPPPAPKGVVAVAPRRRVSNPEVAVPLDKPEGGGRSRGRPPRRQSSDAPEEPRGHKRSAPATPSYNIKRRCRV